MTTCTRLNTHPRSDLGLGWLAVDAAAAILQDDPGPADVPELHGSAGSSQSLQHVESRKRVRERVKKSKRGGG